MASSGEPRASFLVGPRGEGWVAAQAVLLLAAAVLATVSGVLRLV